MREIVNITVKELKADIKAEKLKLKKKAKVHIMAGPGREIQLLSIYESGGDLYLDVGEDD